MVDKTFSNDKCNFLIHEGAEIMESELNTLTLFVEDTMEQKGFPYRFLDLYNMHPNNILCTCEPLFNIHLVTNKQQILILEGSYKNKFHMNVRTLLHLTKACHIQVLTE